MPTMHGTTENGGIKLDGFALLTVKAMAWSVSSWTIGDEDAERNSERNAASDGGHGRRT
jgi:hypothetical protein